jgi:hypothetical protein
MLPLIVLNEKHGSNEGSQKQLKGTFKNSDNFLYETV